MKILAFSDLHDEEVALERIIALAPTYDLVLACGDLSQSVSFTEDFLTHVKNALIIPGNWDSEAVNNTLAQSAQYNHAKKKPLSRDHGSQLSIVGFGFTPPTPYGTFGELSEEEMYKGLSALDIDQKTILMLHCPHYGYLDITKKGDHIGSRSITKIIEEKKPMMALFGHVHEFSGTMMLGKTLMVKLPPARDLKACKITFDFTLDSSVGSSVQKQSSSSVSKYKSSESQVVEFVSL